MLGSVILRLGSSPAQARSQKPDPDIILGLPIQPVRPLLWTLGGAALQELDGKPIRGTASAFLVVLVSRRFHARGFV